MISVIICTYDRPHLLGECLDSVLNVKHKSIIKEIIVIDNNSNFQSKDLVLKYQKESDLIHYFNEPKIGLSNARNAGVQKSSGDWMLFLDDDAKLRSDSLIEVKKTIDNYDFVMFTGIWKAWFASPQPKWFPHDAGNYIVKGALGIREIGDDFVSGGIMVINRNTFVKEVKSFPVNLGMTGNKIGYGEESYVENMLKEKGYKIGINSNVIIDHLVNESKYKVSWHLDAAYQKGYANAHIYKSTSYFLNLIKLLKSLLFGWIRPLAKLILKKKYYRQNFIIEFVGGIKYCLGSLSQK